MNESMHMCSMRSGSGFGPAAMIASTNRNNTALRSACISPSDSDSNFCNTRPAHMVVSAFWFRHLQGCAMHALAPVRSAASH